MPRSQPPRFRTTEATRAKSAISIWVSTIRPALPDGKYYAIDGKSGSEEQPHHIASLYDSLTSKNLGSLPPYPFQSHTSVEFDSSGTVLSYYYENNGNVSHFFLDVPSRSVLRQLGDGALAGIGPQARRWIIDSGTMDGHLCVHFPPRTRPRSTARQFCSRLFARKTSVQLGRIAAGLGQPGGAVTVVDLVEVNRRLTEINMGW